MHNPQMYSASFKSRAFTQWPSRQQQSIMGQRLQEVPREEGPLEQKPPIAEGIHPQENAPPEDRQLAEGEPMLAMNAAQMAAGGEASKL